MQVAVRIWEQCMRLVALCLDSTDLHKLMQVRALALPCLALPCLCIALPCLAIAHCMAIFTTPLPPLPWLCSAVWAMMA